VVTPSAADRAVYKCRLSLKTMQVGGVGDGGMGGMGWCWEGYRCMRDGQGRFGDSETDTHAHTRTHPLKTPLGGTHIK